MRCTMGVGCDEYGACYADAHNAPLWCPLYIPSYVVICLALRRRRGR